MGLNKHEFATIVETNPDSFSIAIKCNDDGFWGVVITLNQTGVAYELLTARGALKCWRNPADAVLYVQEACPECKQVELKIGSWTLKK